MLIKRRQTTQVAVGNIFIGSDHPIVIQSMTNTPTANITATVKQIKELAEAGSELVRITINDDEAAIAIQKINQQLIDQNINIPLIGDFHFNGHDLLSQHPKTAAILAKYRINPGNLGRGERHDKHFEAIIKIAIKNHKAIRIGVNSGSLDPQILAELMDNNNKKKSPKLTQMIFCDSMLESALQSAELAEKLGLPNDKIIISAKASNVQDLIYIYQSLAQRCAYPLHLGLTEAGSETQGSVSSSLAIGILLQQGIGDTIRVSLTPKKSNRTEEIEICKHILQSLEIRHFQPTIISCPGCGRTTSSFFQELETSVKKYISRRLPEWKTKYPNVKNIKIAVMGCIVNGPGESRHADIGISLPGLSEEPTAPVYIKGKCVTILRGKKIEKQFLKILEDFVQHNCHHNKRGTDD